MKDDDPKSKQRAAKPIRALGPDDPWPVGWEEHAEDQLVLQAFATTPSQRLTWLEEALELAWKSGALLPAWERPLEDQD